MSNFTAPGGYPYGSKDPFPHVDLNAIIESLLKAPNADEGSAHAPTGSLDWSGASGFGFAFADAFPFAGDLDVTDGLTLDAPTSGSVTFGELVALDVRGPLTLVTGFGAALQLQDGVVATWLSGSSITLASGATANLTGATVVRGTLTIKDSGGPGSLVVEAGTTNPIAGLFSFLSTSESRYTAGSALTGTIAVTGGSSSFTLEDDVEVELDPPRTWTRRAYRVAACTYDSAIPQANADRFSPLFAAPSLYTLSGSTSAITTIFEIDPPEHGALLVTVTIKSVYGSDPASTVVVATYELVRWADGLTADPVSLSPLTADTHAANASDWDTVKTITITVDANTHADRAYRYGLRVTSSYIVATNVRREMFYDVKLTGTNAAITGK